MPRKPAVNRSRTLVLWCGISQHKAAIGHPRSAASRCPRERYLAT